MTTAADLPCSVTFPSIFACEMRPLFCSDGTISGETEETTSSAESQPLEKVSKKIFRTLSLRMGTMESKESMSIVSRADGAGPSREVWRGGGWTGVRAG